MSPSAPAPAPASTRRASGWWWRLGKTALGGAYAHTRHVAGDQAEYDRLFRAYDVLEADSEEELIDVVQATAKARRLGLRPLPAGARIGVATTSSGAGVWLAHAYAQRGFAIPELFGPVQARLAEHMPPFGLPVNPVDLTAGGTVVPALRILADSGEVDAVVLVLGGPPGARRRSALAGLIGESALPVVVFSFTKPAPSCARILEDLGVPGTRAPPAPRAVSRP